jgi:hypothetical protein
LVGGESWLVPSFAALSGTAISFEVLYKARGLPSESVFQLKGAVREACGALAKLRFDEALRFDDC